MGVSFLAPLKLFVKELFRLSFLMPLLASCSKALIGPSLGSMVHIREGKINTTILCHFVLVVFTHSAAKCLTRTNLRKEWFIMTDNLLRYILSRQQRHDDRHRRQLVTLHLQVTERNE